MRRSALVTTIVLLVTTLAPVAAPAQTPGDPYAADPVRLVPFVDTVQRVYTSGSDVWDVWVCRTPGWAPNVTVAGAVAGLNANVSPYFQWLSNGIYTATFRAGGEVTGTDVIPAQLTNPESLFAPDCEAKVKAASTSSPNGALILVDTPFDEGYATAGAVCPEAPFSGCTTTFPTNSRLIVAGAAAVKTVTGFTAPQWITVAHEIGHALNWAHSYGGLNTLPTIDKYDNPMDVMSGAIHRGQPIGTIAYNRYAAGWMPASQVVVHTSGIALFTINSIGSTATEMVVLPTSDPGRFYILGARRRTSYDAGLPKAGVEVYEVDQRREIACALAPSWPAGWPCFATLIRTKQTPATTGEAGTLHVLGVEDVALLDGWDVQVLSAGTSSFSVRVSERDSGTFIDDDGNLHEPNIEVIAALGITLGCNPPDNDEYCPAQDVTRAEMAAFLIRALGEEGNLGPYQAIFPDVPQGQWYTPYVERLANLGITEGYPDGTYKPTGIVSRAEMAAFLVRAFPPIVLDPPTGLFTDVPATEWYAASAEDLYDRAVTKGCSANPLKYCPTDPVKRDQMASFLARILGLGT